MKKTYQILFLCLICLFSCQCSFLNEASIQNQRKAIIFIPGYYGSALKDKKTGQRKWIRTSQLFKNSGAIVLDDGSMEIVGGQSDLIEDGVLQKIRVIPLLYSTDTYGSVVKNFKRKFSREARVIAFSFDWRKDNMDAVRKLDSLITRLHSEGVEEIDLVTHSMGGLVAAYYLRYGSQDPKDAQETWEGAKKVNKVVMAAVPFKGTMTVFRNMHYGLRFGRNTRLLTGHTIASFPASYQVLDFSGSNVLTRDLKPIPDVIFDSQKWVDYRWGLLRTKEVSANALQRRETFTRQALREAQRFLDLINKPLVVNPQIKEKLLLVIGESRPTLAHAIWLKNHPVDTGFLLFTKGDMKDNLPEVSADVLFKEGDGVITIESAQLPDALEMVYPGYQTLTTDVYHSRVYHDSEMRKGINKFLRGSDE